MPPNTRIELPAYCGIGGEDITEEDLKNITQIGHVAVDYSGHWQYPMRRRLQLILPFLYLGPSVAVKDVEFLRQEGITMLLVIRDKMSAQARMLSGDKVASELGIGSAAVDVAGSQELIAAFPRAIKIINDHLLRIYRQQALDKADSEIKSVTIDRSTFKLGKVVVFCESGNERSACVVAAYLMKMYGLDLVQAVQFLQCQRFCIALDDTFKGILYSYQEILQAERDVAEARQPAKSETPDYNIRSSTVKKRHIEDTMEGDSTNPLRTAYADEERFVGRSRAPFLDGTDDADR